MQKRKVLNPRKIKKQMRKKTRERLNLLKFRQTSSHMPFVKGNRSSCLLGNVIMSNLLKKDPQEL